MQDHHTGESERVALPSWRVKYQRAHDHLDWVSSEFQWFLQSGPYSTATKIDRETRENVILVSDVLPVPRRCEAAIGDCIQNFRSALDHIVWRLAELDLKGQEPPHTTEFPIFRDPDLYRRDSARKIGSLGPGAQALIETLQPYQGRDQTLWTLHDLSRRDKHRTLVVAAVILSGAYLRIREEILDFSQSIPPGPLVKGTELARFALPAGADLKPEVDMSLHIPTQVAFDEPPYRLVLDTFKGIDRAVSQALGALEAHLRPHLGML